MVRLPRVEGVVVPLITPFTADLKVDYDAFEWHVKRLVESGVNGLFPNSTTGEFVHVTFDEALRLVKTAVNVAPSGIMVLPGVSSLRTEDSVRMAKEFVNVGADGVVILPPFFYRSSDEVMYRHFSAVARSVDVPVIIYNNPLNTGVVVPVSIYVRLAKEFSNVSAAKVTFADFSYLVELIREVKAVRKDFSVLTGLDHMLLPTLFAGGDGVVPGLGNIMPEPYVSLVRAFESRDWGLTEKFNSVILQLSRLYWMSGQGVESPAAIKAVLEAMGTPVKRFVREPLRPLSDDEVRDAIKIVDEVRRELG
ncbi:dihydrodipicolinate synthase family protein [Acidilobus sp.]|uniref:dihydrodipicolinate synthase family protein n=1 Tax=Acidilobus sp. TaxID=1872109 RepID=UPI003D021C9B